MLMSFKKAEKRIVLESYFSFIISNRLSHKSTKKLYELAHYEKTQHGYSFSITSLTSFPHFSSINKEIYDKRKNYWYSFKFIVRLQNKKKKNNTRILKELPQLPTKAFEIIQKVYPNGIMNEFI